MISPIHKIYEVWNVFRQTSKPSFKDLDLNYDEILGSIISPGNFYCYIIDFTDMSLSNISSGFETAHGISSDQISHINDILALIHPQDIDFVIQAEKKALNYIFNNFSPDQILKYKASYNFRFQTAKKDYALFNHQSLILSLDDQNNIIKSFNIHTDISHLSKKNNYTCSLIGLFGEPSYLNMEVLKDTVPNNFSKREIEVMQLITKGLTTKEIARQLHITTDTVKAHRKHVLTKSNCSNTAELVAKIYIENWI